MGSGGGTPSPKKPNVASDNKAVEKLVVNVTIRIEKTFGRTSYIMIFRFLLPRAFPATTNNCFFIEMVDPLIVLAKIGV